MALQDPDMTVYPIGTIVVKETMGSPDVLRMEKTDDPMYATEDGWLYGTGGSQAACHGCHAKAGTDGKPGMDAVFTPFLLLMADMDDTDNGAQ